MQGPAVGVGTALRGPVPVSVPLRVWLATKCRVGHCRDVTETAQFPTLDPGVTYLDDEGAPAALYRLVGTHLLETDGPAYWVDAGAAASPDAIRRHAPGRPGRSLRVARAFTGHQHYELVRSLPGQVSRRTALIVAPNLGALYAADEMPGETADATFAATLELLDSLSAAVEVPVLVTGEAYGDRVRAAADRTLSAERTRAGLRVEGESFATDVYHDGWGFQTTIPYWVDLLGARDGDGESERPAVDPAAPGV